MKLRTKDFIKLTLFTLLWFILYTYSEGKLKEVLTYVPNHAFITLGYYAVISVSYNVMFIRKLI